MDGTNNNQVLVDKHLPEIQREQIAVSLRLIKAERIRAVLSFNGSTNSIIIHTHGIAFNIVVICMAHQNAHIRRIIESSSASFTFSVFYSL